MKGNGGEEAIPDSKLAAQPRARLRKNLRAELVVDAYRLDTPLGRGHSAEVWKATVLREVEGIELRPGEVVAVKFYVPSMLLGTDTLRIHREFNIAGDLDHANLARVYDLMLAPNRPHHTFMVMEYVPGRTLKTRLEQGGPLDAASTYKIATQLFGALEQLHSLAAVHRDVKAANIIVTDDVQLSIKLVDLGIVAVEHDGGFTNVSAFLGSKHSASMEQLTGRAIDAKTDIYSAGSVLYHCLRGVPMYVDVGPEAAIALKMHATPERLAGNGPFVQFINRCIAVQAKDRPGSARECLDELARISGDLLDTAIAGAPGEGFRSIEQMMTVLPSEIIPQNGAWTATSIMKANEALSIGLLGRLARLSLVVDKVERTPDGRYQGVPRVLARLSNISSLKLLVWAYFGSSEPATAAKFDALQPGTPVTVLGTVSRADIDGRPESSLSVDLYNCNFVE
jgi:serine/threonine protein kinase